MSTPLSTPIRQAKLGIASTKSPSLANEYKKLLGEQYQRLWIKHQQDLDLIDDIRSYVKARLSIERDYTLALSKLGKQHSSHIAKRFALLDQCDPPPNNIIGSAQPGSNNHVNSHDGSGTNILSNEKTLEKHQSDVSDSRMQKRLANNGLDEPDKACSLYKVWSEHINRLQTTSKNRADQFEQLIMVVDKLKDIRQHKASIGKKCLDTHLKRIHEDVIVSMVDVEKARKLYYEDESQAKKARENEERIKKKRSGLLTKFTDLQAKKEKTSAQREANDIQSTQARNDYIMALAAANAHLQHYYQRDLNDFIHLIDDGVLDHCKIFMATLSECDINSLKDTLAHSQYWSKMINLTGSQKTNSIFLECEQSTCLRQTFNLSFESCNNDPIQTISLEHNADYALQHEIDKWFTWFKKECRNLSQLIHQLEKCQRAFLEGKKSIELNGQTTEDLEPKIIELKQQIRKSEAAKLKAQARLKVIKEGGMQIEEWNAVESEIKADMARAQEELEANKSKEMADDDSNEDEKQNANQQMKQTVDGYAYEGQVVDQVQLQVSKDSDDSDGGDSVHNLASVSRSVSNQQNVATTGYSALTDPSLVWQDDFSSAWGGNGQANYNVVVTDTFKPVNNTDANNNNNNNNTNNNIVVTNSQDQETNRYDLLGASKNQQPNLQEHQNASMTVQSSSPLSAIVDSTQTAQSPYQGIAGEAYKSDYECDYNRTGHSMRSAASSAEPYNQYLQHNMAQADPFGKPLNETAELDTFKQDSNFDPSSTFDGGAEESVNAAEQTTDAYQMLNKKVVCLYSFSKTNDDDLAFEENDILLVFEVNDENWVRARNVSTNEQGYVPASYIKLLDDDQEVDESTTITNNDGIRDNEDEQNVTYMDSEGAWNTQDIQQKDNTTIDQIEAYCRALYDHEPEANTFEDDGLPHLALAQGELMRIIDQGEDDGWWLVEKEDSGVRGHVPSMLVEEIDPNADDDEEYEDDEEADGSDYSGEDGFKGSIKAMPVFDPPVLQSSIDETTCDVVCDNDKDTAIGDENDGDNNNNNNNNNSNSNSNSTDTHDKNSMVTTTTTNDTQDAGKTSSSLIPTSFIIIEPTPEVESKSVVGSSAETDSSTKEERQIVHVTTSKPPNEVSYSVINEEFVLEGPARKPHHHSEQIQHHETPTIPEENLGEESEPQNVAPSPKTPDEPDILDIPAPPCVVIESFEDEKHDGSLYSNEDENEDDRSGLTDVESDQSAEPVYVRREIKHTGNVDVNPMLRLRAEEFSKQIIAEALMLAPGADVGPSTSTAYI